MPNSARNLRQTAPAATRAAVSRAEARSRLQSQISVAIFDGAGQIGVAGTRHRHGRDALALPFGMIEVAHLQRDGRAERVGRP